MGSVEIFGLSELDWHETHALKRKILLLTLTNKACGFSEKTRNIYFYIKIVTKVQKLLFRIRKTSHKITIVKPNIIHIIHDT